MKQFPYIDVVHECLLGGGASLGLVVQPEADGYLVMEDEGPNKTQDEFQVALDDISTSYTHTRTHKFISDWMLKMH